MKKCKIATQCYTLRDYMHTPGQVDRSFAKLREIGFEAVQISGVAADPKDVKKFADKNGLTICATHESGDAILTNIDSVIEKLDLYDCKHTAFPCPFGWQVVDYATTVDLAKTLDEAAVKMAAAGKTLSYHNHNTEFRKINGKPILDIIFENAPNLQAEIDTYWIQMGGCNPTEYVKKYTGRQTIFHLKDFGVLYPNQSIMVPVGSGNLDWNSILPAAEAAGVEWYIIEQDTCHKCPFESMKDSFDYLMKNFVK